MPTSQARRRELHMRRAEREAQAWNDLYPVGTPVRFWGGVREGAGTLSKTRTRAWVLACAAAVVSVEGYSGGIALTHVDVLIEPDAPEDWQAMIDEADLLLQLDSCRKSGLVTGGPDVDLERCEQLLARGRELGYHPRPIEQIAREILVPAEVSA